MTVPGKDTLVLLTLLVTWLALLTSSNDAQPPLESVSRYGHKDFTTKERISNNADTKIRVGALPAITRGVRTRRLAEAEARAVPKGDPAFVTLGPNFTIDFGQLNFTESEYIISEITDYIYGRAMRVGVAGVWALAFSGSLAAGALLTP